MEVWKNRLTGAVTIFPLLEGQTEEGTRWLDAQGFQALGWGARALPEAGAGSRTRSQRALWLK